MERAPSQTRWQASSRTSAAFKQGTRTPLRSYLIFLGRKIRATPVLPLVCRVFPVARVLASIFAVPALLPPSRPLVGPARFRLLFVPSRSLAFWPRDAHNFKIVRRNPVFVVEGGTGGGLKGRTRGNTLPSPRAARVTAP